MSSLLNITEMLFGVLFLSPNKFVVDFYTAPFCLLLYHKGLKFLWHA